MAGDLGYPRFEDPGSRQRFLKRALAAGGTLLVGGAVAAGVPRLAASAQSPEQDAAIFDFALLLEQVQAAFYDEASERAQLDPELLEFARVAGAHEREHVAYLQETLGDDARSAPATDFGDATTDSEAFAATAAGLEDLAVSAYNGQAANLTPAGLRAVATVVSVDARHAAWIRAIAGMPAAAQAVDSSLSRTEVEERLAQTGFVQGA